MGLRAPAFALSRERDNKHCCFGVNHLVLLRWLILLLGVSGLCCSAFGTAVGAWRATAKENIGIGLLITGVGIALMVVSGAAWRASATSSATSSSSITELLGLVSGAEAAANRSDRFLLRNALFPSRPGHGHHNSAHHHHPFAAMLYSDFAYRPPPPSYQASMQEYRLRLLLLDRRDSSHHRTIGLRASRQLANRRQAPQSPPPNYQPPLRSASMHALVHSRPPSYKSEEGERPTAGQLQSTTSNVKGEHCNVVYLSPDAKDESQQTVSSDGQVSEVRVSEETSTTISSSSSSSSPSIRYGNEGSVIVTVSCPSAESDVHSPRALVMHSARAEVQILAHL